MIGGKERETSLGAFPDIRLEQARVKHAELRAEVLKKIDPLSGRKGAVAKTGRRQDRRADLRRDGRQVHRGARRRMEEPQARPAMGRDLAQVRRAAARHAGRSDHHRRRAGVPVADLEREARNRL